MMLISYAFISAVVYIVYSWLSSLRRYRRLPPGPPALPIIGNIHQMSIQDPWKQINKWHDEYGPIISFRVGPFPIIVLGDHNACHDLFDKRGAIYSSRPQLSYINQITRGIQPFMMPYDSNLKLHRIIYRVMLGPAASQTYRAREETEVCRVLHDLLSDEPPPQVLARFTPMLASQLAYGRPINDWGWVERVEKHIHEFIKSQITSGILVDAIPILNRLPRWLSPWKSAAERHFATTMDTLGGAAKRGLECSEWNWTRAVREMKESNSMSWDQFSYTTGELYEGVFMTNKLLIGVFTMICVTQTEATAKAAGELQRVIGPDRLPKFTDLPNLPYLTAYMKEVFRWRPISALPGPHVLTQDDEYKGYLIPAQSTLFANAWAIGFNKAVFKRPEEFMPERWLEGPDVPLATFGYGRRICPGKHIATDTFSITAACLLWAFDIRTTADPRTIDTTRSSFRGVVFRAPDIEIEFRPRSSKHEETIRRAWADTKL